MKEGIKILSEGIEGIVSMLVGLVLFLFGITVVLGIALVVSCSQKAHADSLYVGGWSKHLWNKDDVKNETHYMVAYEHDTFVVGYIPKNSFNDPVYFVAKQIELYRSNYWRYYVDVGVDYGYKNCLRVKSDTAGICFLVVPELEFVRYPLIHPTLALMNNAVTFTLKKDF